MSAFLTFEQFIAAHPTENQSSRVYGYNNDTPWARYRAYVDAKFATATIATTFTSPGTGGVLRTGQDKFGDHAVSVRDFAANLAELTTDATAATQKAINHAYSTGARAVHWPALPGGVAYYYAYASASLDPKTGLSFFGDGMYASILKWDEGPGFIGEGGYKCLFLNTDTAGLTGKPGLSFADMHIRGTMFDAGSPSRLNSGGPALFLDNYDTLSIQRCRFSNIARIVTQCEGIRAVIVNGCEFEYCMRDMARFRSSLNVVVSNNVFRHCDDDPIDVHQAEYIYTAGDIAEGIVITGNVCEDTGRIVCIGGRTVNISNNIMRRCSGGIQVNGESSLEGVNQIFSVQICDNQVLDLVYKTDGLNIFSAIHVSGQEPRATAASSSVIPGRPVTATGVFVTPYAHRNSLVTNAAHALAPVMGVQISNNLIMRTLPAVSAYTDWGFGKVIDEAGMVDMAMTDDQLSPVVGIAIGVSSIGVTISDNVIQNCRRAIHFLGSSPLNGLTQFQITDNSIYDAIDYGISMVGFASAFRMKGRISGNIFDIDPYHRNSLRGAGGTWTASSLNTACGIVAFGSYVSGLVVESNTFLNCCVPVALGSTQYKDNVLICEPSVVGFSVANKGIGTVERAGRGFSYQIIDASPLSATYGALTNVNEHDAASIPTTGFYVIGHYVHNTSPSLVAGWVRLTTGSAHVLNTDWAAVEFVAPLKAQLVGLTNDINMCAHRGYADLAPENTLAAASLAASLGATSLEGDVQITSDGICVIIHDSTVDRTTSGTGNVTAFTASALQALDAGSKFIGKLGSANTKFAGAKVPTFLEWLTFARGRFKKVYPEVKSYRTQADIALMIADVVTAQAEEWTTFSTSSLSDTLYVRNLNKKVGISPNYGTSAAFDTDWAVLQTVPGPVEVWFGSTAVSNDPTVVTRCRANGFTVGVFTMTLQSTVRQMQALGVTTFVSDRPFSV